ncbi:hypothetical protein Tco_0778466 [Tanacetum coccineum]
MVLTEIVVILINDNEYTLYEADFKKLRIDDIALLVFIGSTMIRLRVEDLQLGLESYQKRLSIKRPKLTLELKINWTGVDVVNYGKMKMAYELKLKFREQMRRLASYVGGRTRNPKLT